MQSLFEWMQIEHLAACIRDHAFHKGDIRPCPIATATSALDRKHQPPALQCSMLTKNTGKTDIYALYGTFGFPARPLKQPALYWTKSQLARTRAPALEAVVVIQCCWPCSRKGCPKPFYARVIFPINLPTILLHHRILTLTCQRGILVYGYATSCCPYAPMHLNWPPTGPSPSRLSRLLLWRPW